MVLLLFVHFLLLKKICICEIFFLFQVVNISGAFIS